LVCCALFMFSLNNYNQLCALLRISSIESKSKRTLLFRKLERLIACWHFINILNFNCFWQCMHTIASQLAQIHRCKCFTSW
jgi:hypothetical protein